MADFLIIVYIWGHFRHFLMVRTSLYSCVHCIKDLILLWIQFSNFEFWNWGIFVHLLLWFQKSCTLLIHTLTPHTQFKLPAVFRRHETNKILLKNWQKNWKLILKFNFIDTCIFYHFFHQIWENHAKIISKNKKKF